LYDEGEEDMSFRRQLRLQRQRLFFTVPHERLVDYDVWHLTVYQHAPSFLQLLALVRNGSPVPNDVVKNLVRGLNRIFTGELVEVSDTLILATAGSYSQARTNLLYEAEISVRPYRGEAVSVVAKAPRGVALRVQLTRAEDLEPVELPLTVLRYEFLTRVSEGALPSSFSLECYEDVLAYKAQVLAALERRRELDGELPQGRDLTLRFIDLMDDGRVRPHEVEVRRP
jgi:hypothetical protein